MKEDSPWADDPHVKHPNETATTALDYFRMATDYISLPLDIAVVLADIFLILVILRYRRLRNRTNLYLIHFAFSHMLYITSMPFFYTILDLFYCGELVVDWFCLWTRIEYFAMALTISFAAGFGVDVVIEAKKPTWFHAYNKNYSYLFVSIYIFHVFLYSIAGINCFLKGIGYDFHFYFLIIYYLLLMIILLYLGIRNRSTNLVSNKEWILNTSIIISLCWLPLFVNFSLIAIFESIHDVEIVLWSVIVLPALLSYSISIIAVWKLWKYNKFFRVGFKKLFRRPVPLSDYEELFLADSTE